MGKPQYSKPCILRWDAGEPMTTPHGNLFQRGLSDKRLPDGLYKPIPEEFMYKPIDVKLHSSWIYLIYPA